jgi:tetratricopeptide (TPR) repeat protein
VKDHPDVTKYAVDLCLGQLEFGKALQVAGRDADAEIAARQFLDDLERFPKQTRNSVRLRTTKEIAHQCLAFVYKGQRRHEKALKELQAALDLGEALAKEFPSVPKYRDHLATGHYNLGSIYYRLTRYKEAEQEDHLAMELLERLATDFPQEAGYVFGLFYRQIGLGRDCLAQGGCSAQALDWLERAEKNVRRAHSLRPRESFQADIEVIRCLRARALAQLKRYEEAVAEAQGRGAIPGDLEIAFHVACAYSLLSAAALQHNKLAVPDRARISEAHASRAIELLASMDWKNQRGWYLEAFLKTTKDLDPLRKRPDFIALVKRVEEDSAKQAGK